MAAASNNQTEISKREKELIAATWKQQNDKTATPKDAAAHGQFLSDAQQKLRDQVKALSARMQSRDISEANEEFTDFDKDMQAAAAAMAPSADKLKAMQWKDAIPLEQKALQALLRAEATFRQIEVAFGQRGGGGGGGGNAGRDLASLFDLELDTEKNQYETAQTASPAEQHEKEVEDALAKLDALAKRQEDLANQQHNPQQSFQERWQQEMLRREAEQLQRQMEQLARNRASRRQQLKWTHQATDSQQQSSRFAEWIVVTIATAGGEPIFVAERVGNPRPTDRAGAQTSAPGDRRDEAQRRVRSRARRPGSRPRTSCAQATNLLAGTQQQLASGKVDSLSREADRLTQEQRRASRPDQQVRWPAASDARRDEYGSAHDGAASRARPAGAGTPATLRRSVEIAEKCSRCGARDGAQRSRAWPRSCATP